MNAAKKVPVQFPDRVRFNWGYHDAANDVSRGFARTPIEGPAPEALEASMRVVSRQFDGAYHAGYVEGLADARACLSTESSESAWVRVRGGF